jgi:PPOX class probable F420-dependent enzyme
MDLVTLRKTWVEVHTPVWFAESKGKIYFFTRRDAGKMKRIRNNPHVEVAPCTMRGKPLGPYVPAMARMALKQEEARQAIRQKYFLARIPWIWSKDNIYVELTPG